MEAPGGVEGKETEEDLSRAARRTAKWPTALLPSDRRPTAPTGAATTKEMEEATALPPPLPPPLLRPRPRPNVAT